MLNNPLPQLTITKCRDCNAELTKEWIEKRRNTCQACHNKYMGSRKFTQEIRQFMREEIGNLRSTVSHSRQGKPHKQPFGFHIEHTIKHDRYRITKAKLLGYEIIGNDSSKLG